MSKEINFHKGQSDVIRYLFKPQKEKKMLFATTAASRGFGKSYLGAGAVVIAALELMELDPSIPNKNVALIAPTYQQVVDIYFPLLEYEFGLSSLAHKSSSYYGKFWLPRNVVVQLWSAEAVDRMRGSGQYFVLCDEVTTWPASERKSFRDAWESVIEPCITTRWSAERAKLVGSPRAGSGLIISSPMGYDYFYELCNRSIKDDRWKHFHFTYRSSPFLSQEEIERVKKSIDPIRFAREYEASFEEAGNRVFPNFKRSTHVRNDLGYFAPAKEGMPAEDVHIALDFNVAKMAMTGWAIRGNQGHCLWEHEGSANTTAAAEVIKNTFKGHKVFVYPDPTGNSRKTSAPVGQTDFTILRNAPYNFTVLAPSGSPSLVDSVNAVNTQLLNAAGDVNLYWSYNCPGSISSMEKTSWRSISSDSAAIDKTNGDEHYSDGVRYFVNWHWPIIARKPTIKVGKSF